MTSHYRIRNWSDYNAALVSRGSLHVWLGEAVLAAWKSTDVKVYGEGEWKARKHGISKRRTWLKLHVDIDEETGEILAAVVTPNATGDSEVLGEMLDEIDDDIEQVSADGAYDCGYVYDYIDEREATAAIPPRKDAKIWLHGNRKRPAHPRDENLRRIRQIGRSA